MPYYGLLDKDGNEVHGGGYHRLDASNAHFKISPPSVRKSDHLTFVNIESIQWPPLNHGGSWHVESIALFDEVDSKAPLISTPLSNHPHVREFDSLIIASGWLRIGWKGQRDDDGEPERPPPSRAIESLELLVARLRKENEMLRAENEMLRSELQKIKRGAL